MKDAWVFTETTHIGIVVRDLDATLRRYVMWELIEPLDDQSVLL